MSEDLKFVLASERKLLEPAIRRSVAELDRLLDPEFTEVGASGRTWARADLIDGLVASPQFDERVVAEMSARHVTGDVILVDVLSHEPALAATVDEVVPGFLARTSRCVGAAG